MSEYAIEKVEQQPLVHDPTFIDPATDADGAQGFALTVYCPSAPNDGDVAVYVAAENRFELRSSAAAAGAQPVIEDDGSGAYGFVTEGGQLVYEDPL